MSPSQWRRGAVAATAGLLAVGGFLLFADEPEPSVEVSVQVDAAPRVVDEGDLVELAATVRLSFGEIYETFRGGIDAPMEWRLDDGSPTVTGNDLMDHRHRFADDRDTPYQVKYRIERPFTAAEGSGSAWHEGSVRVAVNNVPPEIRGITYTRPTLPDAAITFEASVVDPGIDDELTYWWEFGDGLTGLGQSVEHTYEEAGVYDLTLTVDDGDGGEDISTIKVTVGETGVFTISGDVSFGETEVEILTLAGTTQNPFQPNPDDPCQLRLSMTPRAGQPAVTLTANLTPGLGKRGYTVAGASEWDGMHRNDRANPGLFFGDVSLPRDVAIRDFNGKQIGGPFWSRGGSVDVTYFDGKFLELTYDLTLVENIPGSFDPRTIFVQGTLATKVERSMSGVLSAVGEAFGAVAKGMAGDWEDDSAEEEALADYGGANFYLCGQDEGGSFEIEALSPTAGEKNVSFLDPEIEITFSRPVDPSTIQDTIQIAYLLREGVESVPGIWEVTPGDDHSVRFVPQARLLDGVNYCIGVAPGSRGVRGRDGEELVPGTGPVPDACGRAGLPWHLWTFATRVEIESARVDLYQASVAGNQYPLAPLKPTAARAYPHWTPNHDLHDAANVKSFPARVSVLVNGGAVYAPKRRDVRRPDLFTDDDRRGARNSINFYDWRPGAGSGVEVKAVIEPIDSGGSPVDRFEGAPITASLWDRTEILSFDYYFLRFDGDCDAETENGCEWSEEVSTAWRQVARQGAFEGARFTTQNFPVLETQPRAMGDLHIDVPALSGICQPEDPSADAYLCYWPGTPFEKSADHYVGEKLWEVGQDSYADILVGFVPPGFAVGWAGVMVPFNVPGKRIVLVDPRWADNPVLFAHEFGHFFELDHCPGKPGRDPDCTPAPIQGLRMNPSGGSGLNKHRDEGNQESSRLVPVMHWSLQPVADAFITAGQYKKLFSEIPAAEQAWAFPLQPRPRPTDMLAALLRPTPAFAQAGGPAAETLVVRGRIRAGEVLLDRVVRVDGRQAPLGTTPAGDWTLELLDPSGAVLLTVPFAPVAQDSWHGADRGAMPFRVETAAPRTLASIRVSGPGGVQVERSRSPHPPIVEAEVTIDEATRRLSWTTSDADGDEVLVDVSVRADDGPWRGLAVESSRAELTLDSVSLPAGRRLTARVVAVDGFNSTVTEIDLGPGAPLAVMATTPVDGATDVAAAADVTAWIEAPLSESLVSDPIALAEYHFLLLGEDEKAIPADVIYEPRAGVLTLTPLAQLAPGVRYTARLEGLETSWGGRFDEPVTWSFTTSGRRTEKPEAAAANGD